MGTRFDRWYSAKLSKLAECDEEQELKLFSQNILEQSKVSFDKIRRKNSNNPSALDYISANFELDYEFLFQVCRQSLLPIDKLWGEIEKIKFEIDNDTTVEPSAPRHLKDYLPYSSDDHKIILTTFRKSQHIFSYQLPSVEIVDFIVDLAENREILELGSGAGLWAKLLQSRGLTIFPTDLKPPPRCYTTIETLDWTEAIDKYRNVEILLLIWLPLTESHSETLLNALRTYLGKTIIFIGALGQLTGGYQVARWLQSNVWHCTHQLPVYVAPHIRSEYKIQFYQFDRALN